MSKVSVVFDFDGSLATTFVGGLMFRGHVRETDLEIARERFVSGVISLREYQEEVFDQVDETPAQMSARAATEGNVRDYSSDVCEAIWSTGGQVAVASAGLNFYIQPILDKAGLSRINVHSGEVVSPPTEMPPFRYDYPFGNSSCRGDWVTCKCNVINELKTSDQESEVIFVGDGTDADRCASSNAADKIFALGRLFDYCNENGIPATEFRDDFKPLLSYVLEKTSANGAQ